MSSTSANEEPSYKSPALKIRYRFGISPDRAIINDPSIKEIMKEMNKIDAAVFLSTVLIPSIYGYRTQSTPIMRIQKFSFLYFFILDSFSSFYFKFGLGTGLIAGSVYAYVRSWARLRGLSIPTPKAI